MKHRIQHPEYRIQKVETTYGSEDVAGGTPTAATGTLLRSEATEGGASVMKKRSGAGKGGWEIGKRCNFFHLKTALTRLFPHKSTQVVDFPHLAVVSQAELGTNMGKPRKNHRGMEAQRQAKLATNVGRLK
jgi:hypothetical protein